MKKAKTIGLLLVVLFIWGKIAWDIFAPDKIEDNLGFAINLPSEMDAAATKQTVTLVPIDRDPFLGKINRGKKGEKKPVKPASRKVKPKKAIEEKLSWPEIEFKGFVKDNEGGIPKAFVSINKQFSTWTEGDSLKGLLLNKVSKDSIVVSYAHQSKSIKKNP